MKNPYEAELAADLILPGRKLLIVFVVVFCAFLILPVTFRVFTAEKITADASGSLRDRLASVEKSVEGQDLFEKWRQRDQSLFLRTFGQGNRRVIVGRDGWLYFRPDIEAVFGKGPRYVEPKSVAREATDESWQSPIPLIAAFADKLASLDIELLVVPVPTKAMLFPEGLSDVKAPVTLPEYESILRELREKGVDVLDLVPLLLSIPPEDRFLKQDTHWTAATMEKVAIAVSSNLRSVSPKQNQLFESTKIDRSHVGDLVGMLDSGADFYPAETQTLRQIRSPYADDPEFASSSHVVLGDSFVNIYEDPALGFGGEGEQSIGAGFASHYSAALGLPVETIAINGGGATAVRRAFSSLHSDEVVMKKSVVWVFSARDLLLAELPARRAGIEWRPVEFNDTRSPEKTSPSALVVTATLSDRSPVGDPKQTTYESAVYSAIFTDIEGDYGKDELFAFLWAFKKRIPEPTADLKPGSRYRLHLIPLDAAVEAGRATQIDDFFRADLDRWFVEKAEPVP